MDTAAYQGLERAESACAACGKRLSEEKAPFAALVPEGESFRRRDYCQACFQALAPRPAHFWRRSGSARPDARAESKDERRERRKKDLDSLVELFDRLADSPQERAEEAKKLRYLLALALVRKKRLQLVDLAREGGADCLVLKANGEAEIQTVPAPALSKEELERLAQELAREVGLS